MNKKNLAAISAIAGLIFALGVGVTPAMAMPELTSLELTPNIVGSGATLEALVNGSSTGVAFFEGCETLTVNGFQSGSGVDHWETNSPPNTQIVATSYNSVAPNFFAENMFWQLHYYANTRCEDLTDLSIPSLESNVLTETPALAFEPVALTEGRAASETVPYTLATETFDWSYGSGTNLVTGDNCATYSPDLVLTDNYATLPVGLAVTSTIGNDGPPVFSFAGTPPVGSAGTYRACISILDGNLATAHAWITFTVSPPVEPVAPLAPAALATTGAGLAPVTIATGSFLLALTGALLLILFRRRQTLSAKDPHAHS